MTKEELEKEAEEKLPQVELDYCHGFMNPCEPNELPYIELVRFRTGFERGYLASAEPREKKITELEAKYYSVSEIAHHRGICCISALKENRELEKENSVLKDDIHTWKEASSVNSYKAFQLQEENKTLSMHILELQNDKGELTDRCKELEAQIEKMKCCGNCRFSESDKLNGTFCHREGCFVVASAKCKLWEN